MSYDNSQSDQLQTAVLFLVFNRPDPTAQVFESIRKAKPPRLYIASDGPRPARQGEADKVTKVREIATAVDWPCEVKTLFRDTNLGCKAAVSGAISWFFECEEQGIILEDDCLPSQSFFWFCEQMLGEYVKAKNVMCITGTNITKDILFKHDYWFSKYALMWGWATWRTAWQKYDLEITSWPRNRGNGFLKTKMRFNVIQRIVWNRLLNQTFEGRIDTWDYQWIYSCWVNGGLTVAPSTNLVANIGFGFDATHTQSTDPHRHNLEAKDMKLPLTPIAETRTHEEADAFISLHWFHASWIYIAGALLTRLLGVKFLRRRYVNWRENTENCLSNILSKK